MFVWSAYRMFYGREKSFDTTKVATINESEINEVESDEGTWKWNDEKFDFYKKYKIRCATKSDIEEFCRIIKSSKSKYIDIAGIDCWINIYFKKNGKKDLMIVLKHNYSNQVFFEYENQTYDGKLLEKYIEVKKIKVK